MIKTIIFDLGGVYFTDGTKRAINIISSKYNIPEDEVKNVLKGKLGTEYRENKISIDEFWNNAKKLWSLETSNKELSQIWLEGYKPIEGTVDIVGKLKQAKYELLFLSDNVQERVDYLEEKYCFLDNFKDGIFSHLAKVRKPNPKIYKLALDKASNKVNECLYIDDKPELLEPAKELGMRVVAFKNPEQLKSELRRIGITL